MSTIREWRGEFTNDEVNALHAEAFESNDPPTWNWNQITRAHSLGWVVARDIGNLIGFVNVAWDGRAHAWVQDTMVRRSMQRHGIGTALVAEALAGARAAGCEWLHVDFEDRLREFYIESCGFTPTAAGLIDLHRSLESRGV